MNSKLPAVFVIVGIIVSVFALSLFLFFRSQKGAPATLRVPEPNEATEKKNQAVPIAAPALVPGSAERIRTFAIDGQGGSLSEREIVVYQNDIIRIQFTAQDDTYDLSSPDFSVKQVAERGETKRVEFQAVQVGNYPFVCEQCNLGNTEGTLTIVPRT